jgi:hypothetical protein
VNGDGVDGEASVESAVEATAGVVNPSIGGHKAADRLSGRLGLDVEKADVETLADRGLLDQVEYETQNGGDPRTTEGLIGRLTGKVYALGAVTAGAAATEAGKQLLDLIGQPASLPST